MDHFKRAVRPQSVVNSQRKVLIEEVSVNTSQRLLETTDDKLRLALTSPLQAAAKSLRSEWVGPLGTLLAFLLPLLASEFRDWKYISGAQMQGVFFAGAIVSAVWLIKSLWSKPSIPTVDEVIRKLKGAQTE